MILCHDCKQQECQDIILENFLIVICSINMISVNVAVLQIEEHNFIPSHNRVKSYIPSTATGTLFGESIIKV